MDARSCAWVAAALAAAALGVLAPVAAAQESCPPGDSACIGAQKLGERASAECRRAGDALPSRPVADPACQTPAGRRVDRAGVAAHAGSWVHRALAFQYALGEALPFRDAPWIGTHNSFNSTSEAPTLSHTDSNQQLSLADQLALDVRSLEIDVHWSPSPRGGGLDGAPVVCHGQEQQGVHVGCTSERLLGDVLAEVGGWLRRPENRREVLLLYLEDHLDGNHAAGREVLDATLGSLVFRAGANDADCRSLPLTLTRRAVLDAGAQVVIVGDCGTGWNTRVFKWGGDVRVEERPKGYTAENCGGVSRATHATRLVRFYEDSTWLTPTAATVSQNRLASADDGITPQTAAAMTRCGVDLIGLDQLLPGDARLPSLVWSWAAGKPAAADGGCALQGDGGRWATGACARPRPAACRTADGGWTVTAAPVAFADAAAACAEGGHRFDLPRTGFDNARLRAVAPAGEVWLDHRAFEEEQTGTGEPEGPGPGGPGSGSGSGSVSAAGPAAASPGSPAAASPGNPATGRRRPAGRALAASCRVAPGGRRARRTLVCRIRVTPGGPGLARISLTRGPRTYVRAARALRGRGGTIAVRTVRPLPRGTYSLAVELAGPARARLFQRLTVR